MGLLFYWIFLMVFVREFFIDFIAYCFQPLIGSVFSGAFHSQMTEPAVRLFLRAPQHAVPPVTAISNFTFLYAPLLGIL